MEKSTLANKNSTLNLANVRPIIQLFQRFNPHGQDAPLACCRLRVSDRIPNPEGGIMPGVVSQLTPYLSWWPVVVGVCVSFAAAFTALRYRIPDLVDRMGLLEGTQKEHSDCLSHASGIIERVDELELKKPSKSELTTAVESFRTVCKFNQATCQKEIGVDLIKIKAEMDKKLADIYSVINEQRVMTARIDERVEILLTRNCTNGNGGNGT